MNYNNHNNSNNNNGINNNNNSNNGINNNNSNNGINNNNSNNNSNNNNNNNNNSNNNSNNGINNNSSNNSNSNNNSNNGINKNIKNNNNNTCNNCGKANHLFHQCKLPIISYGIIAFRYDQMGKPEFLMIRRKDSFGYIDLIRGKYTTNNIDQIQKIVDEMSIEEKNGLLDGTFDNLWKTLWGEQAGLQQQYRSEEISSYKKFELLKHGVEISKDLSHAGFHTLGNIEHSIGDSRFFQSSAQSNVITLEKIIENSGTQWKETEWEFPKGRRNSQEKDLDCAIREFEEETGYSSNYIKVIENLLPFEEIFIGSNHKSYKHKYFLAYFDSNNSSENEEDDLQNFQKSEVSKIEWKKIDECLKCIRPYHLEKKQMISNIQMILDNYLFYY